MATTPRDAGPQRRPRALRRQGRRRGVHRFYREELLAGAQSRKRSRTICATRSRRARSTRLPAGRQTAERQIIGVEALMRWNHPTAARSRRRFHPDRRGMRADRADRRMGAAHRLLEAARWPDGVRVAVNVSPIQFANPALPAPGHERAGRSGLAPDRLELEITEGVFLDESASTERMFARSEGDRRPPRARRFRHRLFLARLSAHGAVRQDQDRPDLRPRRDDRRAAQRRDHRRDRRARRRARNGDDRRGHRDTGRARADPRARLLHIQGYVYNGRWWRARRGAIACTAEGGQASALGHKVSRAPRNKVPLRPSRNWPEKE